MNNNTSLRRRLLAVVLTLTMVFGTSSDLLSTITRAIAEENQAYDTVPEFPSVQEPESEDEPDGDIPEEEETTLPDGDTLPGGSASDTTGQPDEEGSGNGEAEPAAEDESPADEMPADETPADETPADETPADETPADETPADETPADETPADETPADETPADETPADETPADETPADETPADETPADETPADETPADETPADETPADETPADETPADETPADETLADETPADETPADETPADETPADETPADETPVDGTPADETPADETSGDETPVDGTPADETSADETPADETPADETPADETPADETPADETPADETPADETPADETPADETPADETPADETPADETPADETPADETPADETPADETPADETLADETPADETPADETPADETPADETPADETPADETPVDETSADETPADETPVDGTPADEIPADETPADETETPVESIPADSTTAEDNLPDESKPAAAEGETTATGTADESGLVVMTEETVASAAGNEAPAVSLTFCTKEKQIGNYLITAEGNIPENAVIQAVEIPADAAKQMSGKDPLFAYDIRLTVDGKVWQPKEEGQNIRISVKDLSGGLTEKNVDIIHVKTDLMDEEGNLSEDALDKAIQELEDGSIEKERIDTDKADSEVSFDTSSFSAFMANTMAVLQAKFKEAMQNLSDPNEKVTITLEKGTSYEGDLDLKADGYDVGDDFVLELVAEDAGEDDLQADGSTVIAGNILIQRIAVKLAGLVLGSGNKITADHAKLNFFGTAKDDDVTIESTNGSTVNVATGAGKDSVTSTSNGGTVDIRTGDDDDKVTIESTNSTVTADTGADSDTVNVTENGGEVTVTTGAGEDSVTAELNLGKLTVNTGDDADKVQLTDKAPDADVTIATGDGDDTVEMDIQSSGSKIEVNAGAGDDSVTVISTDKANTIAAAGVIAVDLGAGINDVTVSTDVAKAMPTVKITGKDGNDLLHITGKLDAAMHEDQRASGDAAHMELSADSGKLDIYTEDIESITDDLENKRTRKLTPVKNATAYDLVFNAAESFTNYIINAPASELGQITVSPEAGKSVVLSNVVIDTDTFSNSDHDLVIKDGTVIDTRGLTLALKAKNIKVDGLLMADLVQLEALDGTGMYSRNFKELYNGYRETENIAVSAFKAVTDYLWDMVNIKDKASITVGSTGKIYSKGDVVMLARVEQSGTLISTIPVNAVNVKIGDARIDINGEVKAGVQFNDKGQASGIVDGRGTVRADAQVKTTTGEKDDRGKTFASFMESYGVELPDAYPIGVTVTLADASVNVAKGAKVEAGRDISLASKSDVSAVTKAESGLFGAPASIAVAVLLNDANTTVDGTLNAHGGNVRVEANADTTATTTADKGKGQKIKSGGYAAVSVVLQDAIAKVTGNITAGGKVEVNSKASEKVENKAVSAEIKEEKEDDGKDSGEDDGEVSLLDIAKLGGKEILDIIKGETKEDDKKEDKLDAASKKMGSSGSRSAQLDDDAQKKGEVTLSDDLDGNITATVKPWDGYKVKKVIARGYNPGSDKYLECDVEEGLYGMYTITPKTGNGTTISNVFVFVEYEEDESYEPTAADLFDEKKPDDDEVDIQKMLDDLNNNTDDAGEELDRQLNELEDLSMTLTLGAGVLTYETENDDVSCLDTVLAGDKIRLLPNPPADQKLAEDGLKATYYIKGENDKITEKTVTIKADSKGRYFLEIPRDADTEKGVKVSAAFEAKPADEGKKGDEDQTEVVGAIAVTVASNDSQAIIEKGATVVSGKKTDVSSEVVTEISNIADGTPAGKPEESSSGEDDKAKAEEGKAIERPATKNDTETADAMKYGLIIDETYNGKVNYAKTGDYQYDFTPADVADGYSVANVLLTYISGGEKKTKEITATGGKYSVNLANEDLAIDAGTTAHISVAFGNAEPTGAVKSSAGAQTVLDHPIQISYNKEQGDAEGNTFNSIGSIAYTSTETTDGKVSYKFTVTPKDYYKLEYAKEDDKVTGGLTATWTDASGKTQTANLTRGEGADSNTWTLAVTDEMPAGATITVSGKFVEDYRSIKTEAEKGEVKDSNGALTGTVKLYDSNVKKDDKPQILVKPEAGYALKEITVTYKSGNTEKKVTLKGTDGNPVKIEKVSGKDNLYTVNLSDDIDAGTEVTVNAVFDPKSIGIYQGAGDNDKNYTLSEKRVAVGDTVTVTPADSNKKITSITVTGGTVEVKGDKFTVKEGTGDTATLTVNVVLADKEVELKEAKLTDGTLTPKNKRADSGETVTVNVTPGKDFKVKQGTLKAIVEIRKKDETGTRTEEVLLSRQNDTTYTFHMPTWDSTETATVSFVGEFEPGQSDTTAMNTSLGAAVAVTVVNSESRGEIKGGVQSDGAVKVNSKAGGSAKTEAKAGYSKGNIGIGGAVAVQVASIDSKALVHKDAQIKLDGELSVDSTSDVTFDMNADASGAKQAKKAGVGAGIAVAVNGSDAIAAVQDGTSLTKNKKDALKGISVTANANVKDTVNAKAGASGGTAAVPVAAVDVTAANAEAYMGKVAGGTLTMTDDMAVSSSVNAEHTITADASATGKGVGVGAAIIVSVLFDEGNAKLNQSVDAANISVASETVSKVKDTATAGASGGKKEGESKSPDEQADGLLGGAANLAGKNKSSKIDAGKISNATKDRQKAETSEGTVGVAGAVVVNVQFSESIAEVKDGINLKAKETAAVTTKNGTESRVKANASTTNSDKGVGVGIAVNIVNLKNIASIGNGTIEAENLKVEAGTKMTEPEKKEEEKKEDKVNDKDGLATQLGEKVGELVNDLVKEVGLDRFMSDSLIGEIVDPVVTNTVDKLIKESGLDDLFGKGDFSAKIDAAKGMLSDAKDGLMALPEQLMQPLLDLVDGEIDLDSLSPDELKSFTTELLSQFKSTLTEELTSAGGNILSSAKDGMIEYITSNMGDILIGVASGNAEEEIQKLFAKATDVITDAVKTETKALTTDVFIKALEKTLAKTGTTGESLDTLARTIRNVKDVYQKETLDSIYKKASEFVTKTFKEKVFDYEDMIKKVSQINFKKLMIDGLKEASVTLSNEVIGSLTNHFDLVLKPEEEKATGHVIDTQGIAGAGARDVGVAGSVAVTVLNADTSATIADGGEIKVGKELAVAADETVSVKNVASAAVDGNGNASDNKDDAKKEENEVGGGNDASTKATWNQVSMETAPGASLAIREGDKGKVRPRIYITVKDGYKLPDTVKYTYKNAGGDEVTGTCNIVKDETGVYVDAMVGNFANLDDDVEVHLEMTPEEILNTIEKPEILTAGKSGTVTVSVKDREPEKDEAGKEIIQAHEGETVLITISKEEGCKISGVGYSWVDDKGENHDVEFNGTEGKTGKEGARKEFTLVSSNDKETIYSFTMPAGKVTGVVVAFEDLTEEEMQQPKDSETKAEDENGNSVGVGAAFSIVYGGNNTRATIGRRKVTAGEMSVTATADHKENISSVAGSDPVGSETDEESIKKTSVDASVALNILDNTVTAGIADKSVIHVTGTTSGEGEEAVTTGGDLTVTAKENAVTETTSSAFAVGGKTAVGATVAVNIAITNVKAEMMGDATVAGNANISAASHSEDVTRALATAMGADIARNLNKLNKKTENIEEGADKLLDGSYIDEIAQKKEEEKKDDEKKDDDKKEEKKGKTDTGSMINKRMDEQGKKTGSEKETSEENSLSGNAMRSMGVKAQTENAGEEGTKPATDFIEDKTGTDLGLGGDKKKEKNWQVAAAVGVTVASHDVNTKVGKISAGGAINTTAENTGNFNTMGTGSAMSQAKAANSIAAGVAVSVNLNTAKVDVSNDLTADGDLNVTSKLTQNRDDGFLGKLAAQSLSGSVAGADSKVSIGGAISFVYSAADSTVNIAGGTADAKRKLEGANITVEATDDSRLTARAGGLSKSKGSSVGMGIASANVVSKNTITAAVGNETSITGETFKLNAEKKAVSYYTDGLSMRGIVTDSSKLSKEQRENAETGLIDLHKGDDDKSYKLKVDLSTDKLLQAAELLNVLAGQNTYVEAIAGSVMTGTATDEDDKSENGSKLSLAGSFAVAVTNNTIAATLGNNAIVKLTKDMSLNAKNGATTRIIAGSLSAGPAKNSVGATVAVLVTDDNVKAETGTGAKIEAEGNVTQSAETKSDIQLFTAAMAVAAGTNVKGAAGGAINVIVSRNKAQNLVGIGTEISGSDIRIDSKTEQDLMAISGSGNVTAGKSKDGGTYAAGGTINVIYDNSKSQTTVGDGVTLTAANNVDITSDVRDQLISGTASLSVAASKGGKAGAGVINFLWSDSKANTKLGSATVTGTAGDVNVNANNDAWMLNATMSVAGASETAIGAGFNINVFEREATVDMSEGTVTAGRDLKAQSSGRDTSIMAALGASGSTKGSALSGTVAFLWEGNTIGTRISKGITATAGRNAILESYFSDLTVGAAGNIAISGKGSAYGVTSVTAIKNNSVQTSLASSKITANQGEDATTKSLTGLDVRGILVNADAKETQFLAGAGIAGSKDTALNGVVTVLVNNNVVKADASVSELTAEKNNADVMVTAADDTRQTLVAGSLTISAAGSALGASVATLVSNKTVEALAHDLHAYKDVKVSASNKDNISTLAVSVGGSGGGSAIELGAAVQVLKSRVNAKVGSTVISETGSFDLNSANNTTLLNVAGAIAASSGGAAVTPVGAITYFQGESNAVLKAGSTVTVKQGDINITTESNKDVGMYTLGISVGSGFGLSGAANVLISKDKAYAGTEHIEPRNMDTAAKSTLTANGGKVNVKANSEYRLRAVSGAAAASGGAAIGVNAVVSILKSNATAELSGNTTAGREVNVTAKANRDVINTAATLAAGTTAGGITVMVLVAGTKMSQDAADMIARGNGDDKNKKTGFDASTFMENAEKAGVDMNAINAGEDEEDTDRRVSGDILAKDLEGNGHRESDQAVGSSDGEASTFDGASGYRSDEIDSKANDTEDKDNRGENLEAEDTEDVKKAKQVNTYTYTEDPEDAVIARIMAGSTVSAEEVYVAASQGVAADLIGASLGAGSVGAGVSTVVAIMRSNVLASSDAHILKAANGVTVKAESKSGEFFRDAEEDSASRTDTVLDMMSNKSAGEEPDEDATEEEKADYEERKKNASEEEKKSTLEELKKKFGSRNIRAFSVAMGAGQVGLAVSVAVVLTDNVTQAILGGTVENAGDVTVEANHDYDSVMAATGAVSGGLVAAGASVAVAQANGTVRALIRDGATVTTNTNKNIKVATDSNVGVDTAAVTAGLGGYAAVNAGLALSINRLKQETGIGAGTTINSGKDIIVDSVSDTSSNSYLLGVTVAGIGAVMINAAVSDVAADINTHIGGASAASTITAARDITVKNTTSSSAVPKALAVAAGGVAVGGNILLAFNDTKAIAAVDNATVNAADMTVSGDISGDATSDLTSITAGAIAVGISVNYADMRADNRASVTDSELDLTGSLKILTGADKNSKTIAEAHTISGNVGLITVGMNAAIARNNTKNYAILEGAKTIKVGKDLTVHGAGASTAIADMKGFDLGAASVAVSAVVALNDADARSQVLLNNDVTVTGKAAFDASQNAETTAKLWTGGGSLLSAKVSAAVAYGRADALVDAELHGEKADLGSLSSKINASDTTTANIDNLSFDAISASARFAGAYSQDVFRSKVVMSSAQTEIHGNVDVITDYDINTTARVRPSTGGVDVSLASLAINSSIAKNTAGAAAYFEAIKGNASVEGDLNVLATGVDEASAEVETATISIGGISLGANIAKSDLSARQAAYLRVGGTLTVTGKADIQSIAKKAIANSQIGASGGASGLSLKLANLDVSHSIARENMESSASVLGGPIDDAIEYYYKDEGKYVTKTKGYYDYELKHSGYHIVRDENGVAQQEMVTWIYYDTGETAMMNALGEIVLTNYEEGYTDEDREEDFRLPMMGDMMRYDDEYFEWVEEEVTEWEENRVRYERKVDVYNPDDNMLTAAALTIISSTAEGSKTGATASTRGAESIGIATAGSLDAKAYSTDSFGVAFEGMTADIKGAAILRAESNTVADAQGSMPGSLSLADSASSDVTAQVGRRDDKQTISILIGQGNNLSAKTIDIQAKNYGSATAWLNQGAAFSLGKVKKSTQPTESFYNTVISIGRGATLDATEGDLTILSSDVPTAVSKVNSTNVGLLLNYNNMMGKNLIDQENNIDIGSSATVKAKQNVTVAVDQHTLATAETQMKGGGILDGATAQAKNSILRVARINVGADANVTATDGILTLQTISGANDNIHSDAYTASVGGISLANAKAYVDLATYAEINIEMGATLKSKGELNLDARATSYNSYAKDKDGRVIGAGTISSAVVDAAGLIPLPQTVARNTLLFQSYINVNKRPAGAETVARRKAELESEAGDLNIIASNEGLVLYARTHSSGKGLSGTSNANSWNDATLTNAIWIDDAKLTGDRVRIYADNGSMLKNGAAPKAPDFTNFTRYDSDVNNKYKPRIISHSYAKLAGIGKVAPDSRITGEMINQIRSHATDSVGFVSRNSKEDHRTTLALNAIWQEAKTDVSRTKILGIPLSKDASRTVIQWGYFNRCDFCGEGIEYDIDGTAQKTMDKRYEDAFKKILSPINDIQRMVDSLGRITKARYGEEDFTTAGKKFVLDVQSILEQDVRLTPDEVKDYRLWTNMQTFLNVYLLPNATRLYVSGSSRLQYAVDVISGDLFSDGRTKDIEIITALTRNAFANPVIPIGSTGSLDLRTGLLTLPDQADYELYLHEISGKWLLECVESGFIRALVGNPEEINAYALEGGNMPSGMIEEKITEGEQLDIEGLEDFTLYWIGATPETATDPEQPLIGLLYNAETDEIDAFRTSLQMLEEDELLDVSLYMYRDSKSDRMGEEKYNAMFFDTPNDEDSLVKTVTSVLADRKLETPLSMEIVLRGLYMEGADMPVYTLMNHTFILCDGTDGSVDLLGGYHVDFDGDTFDSNYTRIEGIRDGDLTVTVKQDQPVWPEWTGEESAVDIEGTRFKLLDDKWEEIPENTTVQAGR